MSKREVIDLEEAEPPRVPAPSGACICIDVDDPDTTVVHAKRIRGAISELTLQGGIIDHDICDHAEVIVQQLNCIGVNGRGLAKAMADTFPYGCSYAGRARSDKWGIAAPNSFAVPGSIDVRRPPRPGRQPLIVNFFSQWEMGAPLKYNRATTPGAPHVQDSAAQREAWFAQCLEQLARLHPRPASVAFPYLIGCGLGGGSWDAYQSMITAFARENPSISVLIIRRPGEGETGERPRAQGGGPNARKKPRPSEPEDTRRITDFF
jgi:hypothetical protein